MKFQSRTEAYSFAVLMLMRLKHNSALRREKTTIEAGIRAVKMFMENHEQDVSNVVTQLEHIKAKLQDRTAQQMLVTLIKDIKTSTYVQTPKEKFENPLARRAESELGIILLVAPTPAMMTSVGRVSAEIIKLIEDHPGRVLESFNNYFAEGAHEIAFGAPKEVPTLDSVIELLKENNPAQLTEIMHIHFKFSHSITREVTIHQAPVRKPVGKLADIVADIYPGKPAEDFFRTQLAVRSSKGGRYYRAYIADEKMYHSPLYTVFERRGRAIGFDRTRTHQLGLMLRGQEQHEFGLPSHPSAWSADCKSQPADLRSPYVTDLINNDAVYVAGPSGMTSMLLNQMEILANFENENLKKNYLSAVSAYIVGGGFHSLHEVIGPAQYALNLVPGYKIQIPSATEKAPPPNFHQFFAQQALIDPEFASRREMAWANYLTYFSAIVFKKELEKLNEKVVDLETRALHYPPYEQSSLIARAFHTQLRDLSIEFFRTAKTPAHCKAFKIACDDAIAVATRTLNTHYGWTEILQDFAFITTSFVTLGLANLVSFAATGNTRFFKTPTAEAKESMAEFKQELDKVIPGEAGSKRVE